MRKVGIRLDGINYPTGWAKLGYYYTPSPRDHEALR